MRETYNGRKKFYFNCINQYKKAIIENDVSSQLIQLKNSLLELEKIKKL